MAVTWACTFQLTTLLFWLVIHGGSFSESRSSGTPSRAETDTAGIHAPRDAISDSTEEIMADVELLSDLDILMDLEFLELLEMLEAENLSFADTLQEETHGDSIGRN